MFESYSIKNFRVFENKATIKFKPLTILTGPNNSGKSSLNKALLLLRNVFIDTKINNSSVIFPLELKSVPEVKIGNLKNSLSDGTNSTKIEYIFNYLVGNHKMPIEIAVSIDTNFKNSTTYYEKPVLDEVSIKFEGESLLKTSLSSIGLLGSFWVKNIDFIKFISFFNSIKSVEIQNNKRLSKKPGNEDVKHASSDFPESLLDYLSINNITAAGLFNDEMHSEIETVNKKLPDGFEIEFLKMLQQIDFSADKGESIFEIVQELFIHLDSITSKKGPAFKNASKLYSEILLNTNKDAFPRFQELLQQINNFFSFLLDKLRTDLKSFEYLPHAKLSSYYRGIPKHDNNWLLNNLSVFENSTSIWEDWENSQRYYHLEEYKDNDLPFFSKWSFFFGLSYQLSMTEDEHGEFIHIFLNNHSKGIKRHISDFGSAYAHIIILLIVLANKGNNVSLIIEEPEANLHPKFQSFLADTFVDFTKTKKNNNKSLLIETHSEYLIRKLQYLIAKGECNPDDVVIYYIDDPDPAKRQPNAPQVREITIDKHGRMSQDFGTGFFDEADNIAIQLFNLNQQNFN